MDKKKQDVDKKRKKSRGCGKKTLYRKLKSSLWNKRWYRDRFTQIKWCFGLYIPLCLILAFAGSFVIGNIANYIQDFGISQVMEIEDDELSYQYEVWYDEDGTLHKGYIGLRGHRTNYDAANTFLSVLQSVLIIIWVLFSVFLTGKIFYNRELKVPIYMLMDASRRIADNQLDFKLEYNKPNEFGMLCRAFDEMRQALYESNRELWRSLEERKRLNAAFSHDLRTPLTVLRGYADFLKKYIPGGKVSEEKLLGVLEMMSSQIVRLEHYTKTMNSVGKLGDIVPSPVLINAGELGQDFRQTGEFLCAGKEFVLDWLGEGALCFDVELVSQIYENLVSNASRYAKSHVFVQCFAERGMFFIVVRDDRKGFRKEALQNAAEPFFRDEEEKDKTHFGLGLYICRILCEKCGGVLKINNIWDDGDVVQGAKVTAIVNCEGSKVQEGR